MAVGTIILSTFDATINLTISTVKKVYNHVYFFIYGDKPEERKTKKELMATKKELEIITSIFGKQSDFEQPKNIIINDDGEKIIEI